MRKYVKLFTVLVSILVLFANCDKVGICTENKLSSERTDYIGTELRINGYYYDASGKKDSSEIYYFYKNGIFHLGETVLTQDAENGRVIDTYDDLYPRHHKWGAFRVDEDNIEIETWALTYSSCIKRLLISGKIQSDTSFLINRIILIKKNGKTESDKSTNTLFMFHEVLQKPDSTNSFVK